MRKHPSRILIALCPVLCLCCTGPPTVWSADVPERRILRERTARWEHEREVKGEDGTVGAEFNPTGSPVGGGKGYKAMVTGGKFTVRRPEDLRKALKAAADGDVVFLPDGTEIDLSGRAPLILPRGGTLAGTRGQGDSKGARLFSTDRDTPSMIKTAGPYCRITGLRIEGPFKKRRRIPQRSRGVVIGHFGVEVDNCELWGFTHAAVSVRARAIRAYIHHSYLHHNIRDGLGYGVVINAGTALIEANRFDSCRHYIAATGNPGTGYEARYNICGPHCTSHQFDMHGGRDRGDGTDIAGDWMNVHHNTFLSRQRALLIRGVPSQRARVHRNRFMHGDGRRNVGTWSGRSRIKVGNNAVGPAKKGERSGKR
jgi:hypothetical protein